MSPQATQTVDLGFRPRAWQSDAYRSLKRFSVWVVHRRGGKTVSAIMLLIDRALRCKRPKPRYGYIAPQLKQGKAVAWDYLKHYAVKIPGTKINESELWVELPNGARIRIYGADAPDSLRGLYFDGLVCDEVAQMKSELWGEILQPALSDRDGWALFIGTPKGINLFSELYYRAQGDPNWFARIWTINDTDALSKSQIEQLQREMSETQFAQEMLCDFSASGEDVMMPITLVQGAMGKHLTADQYSFAAKVIGVDVARFGDDDSCIIRRQGLAVFKPRVLHGVDNITLAGHVATEITEWKPDGVFIDASPISAGVIDALRKMGHDVMEIQFGGKVINPRFADKRTEMWWGIRDHLLGGGVLPDDPRIRQELSAPTYGYTMAGKLIMERKDSLKERVNFSPDIGDALCLTFAYPVAPRTHGIHALLDRTPNAAPSYDPYDRT